MKFSLLSEFVLLVLAVSRSEGCGSWEDLRLLPNSFQASDFPGHSFTSAVTDLNGTSGNFVSVYIDGVSYTPLRSNSYAKPLFDHSIYMYDHMVYASDIPCDLCKNTGDRRSLAIIIDEGVFYRDPVAIPSVIDFFEFTTLSADMFIAPLWTYGLWTAFYEFYETTKQTSYSGGVALGQDACILETIESRLSRYGYGNTNVTSAYIASFLHIRDPYTAVSQATLVVDSENQTYVMIQYDRNSIITRTMEDLVGFVNWGASEGFSYSCYSDVNDLTTRSNSHCGIPGLYVYKANDACNDTAVCENLDPNLTSRSSSCREPVSTKECYVSGVCRYLNGSTDSFMFDFTFNKTISGFEGLEVLNSTDQSGGSECVLNVTDDGYSYRVNQLIDSNFIDNCGVITENETVYTFMLHQYEIGSNDIIQRGSKLYNITCDPASLSDIVSFDDLTVGDIVETVRPNTTDKGFSLSFVTEQGPGNQPFSANAPVVVGQPIFIEAKFYPVPTNYTENVDIYGLFPVNCWISAEPHLNTNIKLKVLQNGCPYNNRGFQLAMAFLENNANGSQYGDTFSVQSGSFRAARFRHYGSIYAICEVRVCYIVDYPESFCYDSCNGQGINVAGDFSYGRKRRQASDEEQRVLVSAGLTIIDSEDEAVGEALGSQSCVNETIAYITISSLVIMLFMATVITGMFFLKLQSRKRK